MVGGWSYREQGQAAEKDLQRKLVENLDMTRPRIERGSCFIARCQFETAQVHAVIGWFSTFVGS
jgi:hypothetical protein